jgi:hypothetical protein
VIVSKRIALLLLAMLGGCVHSLPYAPRELVLPQARDAFDATIAALEARRYELVHVDRAAGDIVAVAHVSSVSGGYAMESAHPLFQFFPSGPRAPTLELKSFLLFHFEGQKVTLSARGFHVQNGKLDGNLDREMTELADALKL